MIIILLSFLFFQSFFHPFLFLEYLIQRVDGVHQPSFAHLVFLGDIVLGETVQQAQLAVQHVPVAGWAVTAEQTREQAAVVLQATLHEPQHN